MTIAHRPAGAQAKAESAAITAHIVELRNGGLSWGMIAIKMGLSREAVRQRYGRGTRVSPDAQKEETRV